MDEPERILGQDKDPRKTLHRKWRKRTILYPPNQYVKDTWEAQYWLVTDCCNEIVLPEVMRFLVERDLEAESPFKQKNQPEGVPMCPNPDKAKCMKLLS